MMRRTSWRAPLGVAMFFTIQSCASTDSAPSESAKVRIGKTTQAVESCSGGTDDDLDGLIDCVDPDCSSEPTCDGVQACDGKLYAFIPRTVSGDEKVHEFVHLDTSNSGGLIATLIKDVGVDLNAGGYNLRDGKYYMIQVGTKHLVRVDAKGNVTNLGTVANLPMGITFVAGDVDDQNNLWTKDNNSDDIYKIPLTEPYTAQLIDTQPDPDKTGLRGSDIVFDRDLQVLYGAHGNKLYVFDIRRGTTTVKIMNDDSTQGGGSRWIDADGFLYAMGNIGQTLRRINPRTGESVIIGELGGNGGSDGASCSYGLPAFERCGNGIDDDGDRVVDEITPYPCIDFPDTDGDGVVDGEDLDDDNDGIPDVYEPGDADGDGVPGRLDLDSDNDGILDVVEAGHGAAAANGMIDGEPETFGSNGLFDALETLPDSASLSYTPSDADGDKVLDAQDLDSDNDAISDLVEAGYDPATLDQDDNGVIDGPEDVDLDGILDRVDGNTVDYGNGNVTFMLRDTDGDSVFDFRELSSNAVTNDIEATAYAALDVDDNGQLDSNEDVDGDGIVDAADGDPQAFGGLGSPDSDGDGVLNAADADDDNDGIPDSEEGLGDADGDGTPNQYDVDSDGDGAFDVVEAGHGAAHDGFGRLTCTGDLGTNGMCDAIESEAGSGQLGYPLANTDVDTTPDYLDDDDDGDTILTKSEIADEAAFGGDVDGDGAQAYLDLDADGDGALDSDEMPGDANRNGLADYLDSLVQGPDTDGDSVPDEVECSSAPCRDTDGDNTPDYLDPDDDGDGIATLIEFPRGDTDDDSIPDYLDDTDDTGDTDDDADDTDDDDESVASAASGSESIGLAGGAGCSVSARVGGTGGSVMGLTLFAAALVLRARRRRAA